jgi:hypothetical protein
VRVPLLHLVPFLLRIGGPAKSGAGKRESSRKAGIVNNQRLRRTRTPADSLKRVTAHRIEHRFVRPRRIGYKMMQALVLNSLEDKRIMP